MQLLTSALDSQLEWLAHGFSGFGAWQIVAYALITTHITIASVTIFLHRSQAHRALHLHPAAAHFFRFWLWLSTGIVTREWVAIHRKHHAKCDTDDDPHSPQTQGIKAVLFTGRELYMREAKNRDTLDSYGTGTPDDWIERTLYTRFSWHGVGLMLLLNLLLFGVIGATVWAVQMAWIPITAAGIVNGIGHWWGYRNFEAPDASRNIVPWGLLIGGEELHNNHHTHPTSAKLSVRRYEFDLGWCYIRGLEMLGLARVRRTAPKLKLGPVREEVDSKTLEALITCRHHVMSRYAQGLRRTCRSEAKRLQAEAPQGANRRAEFRVARRWLHRDADKIPNCARADVSSALARSPTLVKLVTMREELRRLWMRPGASSEQLVAELQTWLKNAETSRIAALHSSAVLLRGLRL